MFVHALCVLKMGEELTCSYMDINDSTAYKNRQELFARKWKFECDCQLCKLDAKGFAGRKQREDIMKRYTKLHKEMYLMLSAQINN